MEQNQSELAVYLQRENKETVLRLKDLREDKLSSETEVQYSCQAVLLPQRWAEGIQFILWRVTKCQYETSLR